MVRAAVTSLCCAAALAVPVGDAFAVSRSARSASTPKRIVKNVTINGPSVKCHARGYTDGGHLWGYMELQLKVTKTETTVNGKPKVAIKINSVSWPVFPNHTSRSVYINQQALPLLQQETLQLQASAGTKLVNVSGATNTTVAWQASLQAALLKAEKP
jgi:uncharacterized protein with FMN-binding domain